MKNIRPFGPSIGKCKISKNFINRLNGEFDTKVKNKLKRLQFKISKSN